MRPELLYGLHLFFAYLICSLIEAADTTTACSALPEWGRGRTPRHSDARGDHVSVPILPASGGAQFHDHSGKIDDELERTSPLRGSAAPDTLVEFPLLLAFCFDIDESA